MFLPERYRRQPWVRPSSAAAPEPGVDAAIEPDAEDELADDPDEEDAQLTDEAFLKALRADVQGVREGTIPSITDAIRPSPKDRPWGPKA